MSLSNVSVNLERMILKIQTLDHTLVQQIQKMKKVSQQVMPSVTFASLLINHCIIYYLFMCALKIIEKFFLAGVVAQ